MPVTIIPDTGSNNIYVIPNTGANLILSGVGSQNSVNLSGSLETIFPHNNLRGLQGGETGQFYHLTSDEYSFLVTGEVLRPSDSGLFYPASNPSGFITGVDLSDYVTGEVVRPEDTGIFYTTDNPSGYITGVDLSDYAQKSISNTFLDDQTINGDFFVTGDVGVTGELSASNIGTISSSNYTESDTPPPSPTAKDRWLNTSNLKEYIYYDGYWVETAGAAVTPENLQSAIDSGDYVFGGKVSSTGQGSLASLSGNDLMTKSLGDEAYGYLATSSTPSTRTTQNVYIEDDDLQISLLANSSYYIEMHIHTSYVTSTSFLFRFKYSGTIDGSAYLIGLLFQSQSGSATQLRWTNVTANSTTEVGGGSVMSYACHGILMTGTSGVLSLETANGSASGSVIRKSGIIRATKL